MNIPEAIDKVLSEQFSDESNVKGSLHELEIVETIEQMKKAQILPEFIDAIAQKGSFGTTFGAGFVLGMEVQKKLDSEFKKSIRESLDDLQEYTEVESFLEWLKTQVI